MKKLCLSCHTAIVGRSDKKFCDDHCRSSHYQLTKSDEPDLFRTVNRVLKKNREILSRLNPSGKVKVSRTVLLTAGFDLSFHTQVHKTANGNIYFFCYEYGYLELVRDEFLLVKRNQVSGQRSQV
jgi:hypothetical protein